MATRPLKTGGLSEYRRKRDFRKTREPRATRAVPAAGALRFVIQKHAASHLHFDLRLELDGVMKSWAVPKGPSRDPAAKRLAMQVEDHPIPYNEFEGTIPKGEYGGGTVMIWDQGTFEPEDGADGMRRGLEQGRLSFTLDGKRLQGAWTLVRMQRRGQREWLLMKRTDAAAVPGDDLAASPVPSIVSGRSMDEIAVGAKARRQPRRRNRLETMVTE